MYSKKINILARIKDLYDNGENIIQYLKSLENTDSNSIEDILISYDFQAGSYTRIANEKCSIRELYYDSIAKVLNKLGTAK